MKNELVNILGTITLAVVALVATPVAAQTTANGPYYATPSWDQQLPASTRFIVLANWGGAAVLDRETGLVWEKSPDTTLRTWELAQYACMSKNVGGRGGWKLPSVQEVRSLFDSATSNPPLPAGHPFTNVQSESGGYWSATTVSVDPSLAWRVPFDNGLPNADTKLGPHYVWCVRGGSAPDAQ